MKSKEEILSRFGLSDESCDELGSRMFDVEGAMDEYAKGYAIDFLNWYAMKAIDFVRYLQQVKPDVMSNEI